MADRNERKPIAVLFRESTTFWHPPCSDSAMAGQPRNRRRADIVAAGDRAQGFLVNISALDRFPLLVRGELRLATESHALRLRVGAPARRALLDSPTL